MMTELKDLLQILDAQCEDYQAMYREGLVQHDCLRGDDLPCLNGATARVQTMMDRVRRRHVDIPADLSRLEREHPEVAQRAENLRQMIRSVIDLRDQSERATRQLLDDTRQQLRQVGKGRRASRGYRQSFPQQARFVDDVR